MHLRAYWILILVMMVLFSLEEFILFYKLMTLEPRIDKENRAALQIRKLSEIDFPKNPKSIDDFRELIILTEK